jgi:hypothetical protein
MPSAGPGTGDSTQHNPGWHNPGWSQLPGNLQSNVKTGATKEVKRKGLFYYATFDNALR